jgi:hypothetical protein
MLGRCPISARGSEVIFGGEGGAGLSPATALCGHPRLAYSSSFSPCMSPTTTTPSTRSKLARADRRVRVMRVLTLLPHLARRQKQRLAGLCTLPASLLVGCQASSGRIPLPFVMRVGVVSLCGC